MFGYTSLDPTREVWAKMLLFGFLSIQNIHKVITNKTTEIASKE